MYTYVKHKWNASDKSGIGEFLDLGGMYIQPLFWPKNWYHTYIPPIVAATRLMPPVLRLLGVRIKKRVVFGVLFAFFRRGCFFTAASSRTRWRATILATNPTNRNSYDAHNTLFSHLLTISLRVGFPPAFVRACGRRKIGKTLGKSVKVSVVAVCSFDGANEEYKKVQRYPSGTRINVTPCVTLAFPPSEFSFFCSVHPICFHTSDVNRCKELYR